MELTTYVYADTREDALRRVIYDIVRARLPAPAPPRQRRLVDRLRAVFYQPVPHLEFLDRRPPTAVVPGTGLR